MKMNMNPNNQILMNQMNLMKSMENRKLKNNNTTNTTKNKNITGMNNHEIQKSNELDQIISIESVIPLKIVSKNIINDEQYDVITQICVDAIKEKKEDLALYCTEKIQEKIKGQWFVFINDINADNYEFKFSNIKWVNTLVFRYKKKIIYVNRL